MHTHIIMYKTISCCNELFSVAELILVTRVKKVLHTRTKRANRPSSMNSLAASITKNGALRCDEECQTCFSHLFLDLIKPELNYTFRESLSKAVINLGLYI